jgi:putative peptidoglycan lipid II flippase
VGLAAFQAMLLITLFLASRLPAGSVGAINYSWPLIMLPVGALGTAAATAIFPTLSRFGAVEDLPAVQLTLARTLRLVLFLALPASIGLIILRRPIVNLLYNHGAWTLHDTEQTAFALLFYAIAIGPLAVIEVLARVFYAMKDTMTPVRIAVVAVALDAALSILFVSLFPSSSGQGGLALATAIASTVQVVWLAESLDRKLGGIGRRGLLLTLRDAGLACLIMGMLLYIALDPLGAILGQHGLGVFIIVAVELCLGGGAFWAVTHALDAPELQQAWSIVLRQK